MKKENNKPVLDTFVALFVLALAALAIIFGYLLSKSVVNFLRGTDDTRVEQTYTNRDFNGFEIDILEGWELTEDIGTNDEGQTTPLKVKSELNETLAMNFYEVSENETVYFNKSQAEKVNKNITRVELDGATKSALGLDVNSEYNYMYFGKYTKSDYDSACNAVASYCADDSAEYITTDKYFVTANEDQLSYFIPSFNGEDPKQSDKMVKSIKTSTELIEEPAEQVSENLYENEGAENTEEEAKPNVTVFYDTEPDAIPPAEGVEPEPPVETILRGSACGSVTGLTIEDKSGGLLLDGPVTVNDCDLGQNEWVQVKWDNGKRGWVPNVNLSYSK